MTLTVACLQRMLSELDEDYEGQVYIEYESEEYYDFHSANCVEMNKNGDLIIQSFKVLK